MVVTFILVTSILLQFTAAGLALRLIRVTGNRVTWVLIATAIFLMGVRRSITLFRLVSGDIPRPPDLSAELVALVISILMVVGIAWVAPLFSSIKRSEEALRESEKNYRELANSITDVFFAFNMDLRYTYWNRASEELTGVSAKDALGKHLYDIFPRDKQTARAEKAYVKALRTKQPQHFINEYQLRGKDVVFEISAYPSEDGLSVFVKDITQRKQAEEETKQLQEYLQLQIDRMPIGLIVWDTEFHMQSWNPAAESIFGFTAEEALGKHPYDLIVPKEAQPHVGYIWHRLLKGDTTAHSINENITKDGRTIICDWSNTPLKNANGTVMGVLSMVQDITERIRAEEKIKRAAEEWTTTFDSITDLVFITDKDYKLVRVNKVFADVFKMKPMELIGKPCYEILHGTNEPVPNCPYKKTLKTKKPATSEFFEPHLGIYLEVMTSPIFDDKGEVVASVHIARDITERKRMEERLIVTDRLASIGELASGIAHELNNPLTSVVGFSDLLLGKKGLPSDVKEDLRVINREAQRTAEVVRNLLTFARKHAPTKQPVDINNSIQKVLELRTYEQKVNNIEVNTRFASDLPEIIADGFQLQQVFLNIIINDEHFMTEAHRRGTITITTERVGDIIRASFTDDGPGIPKENLWHVFDPFFTTKEVGKGTGLGLSICYGIITEHGGRIYAESKLGKGATFVVELPISSSDREGAVK